MIAQIVPSNTIRVSLAVVAPCGTGEIHVSLGANASAIPGSGFSCYECCEAFNALPEIIEYQGRRYAKSCYDSDRGIGVYLTSAWLFERLATIAQA